MLRVRELYIWSFGGAWSQGRHQRPKTAAAFSERAAMACCDVRVGGVQRCVSNFQAGGLAGKRYQCALLLGAVREWQQRSSDSKGAMYRTRDVAIRSLRVVNPASPHKLVHRKLLLCVASFLAQAVVRPRWQASLPSKTTSAELLVTIQDASLLRARFLRV